MYFIVSIFVTTFMLAWIVVRKQGKFFGLDFNNTNSKGRYDEFIISDRIWIIVISIICGLAWPLTAFVGIGYLMFMLFVKILKPKTNATTKNDNADCVNGGKPWGM